MGTIRASYQYLINNIQSEQGRTDQLAKYLINDLFGIFDMSSEKILNEQEWEILEKAVADLKANMPLQYITGIAHFYGYKFKVNQSVLIPRPETEELVFEISQVIKDDDQRQKRKLLDIGTGSGCIAITLKKNFPDLNITAMDKSESALKVALENMQELGVKLNLIKDDILHLTSKTLLTHQWDYIISNPPYIDQEESRYMDEHVLKYEPQDALFPSGVTPLEMYSSIISYANTHLATGGWLFLELSEFLSGPVFLQMESSGFCDMQIVKDMQGKPRILSGKYLPD
ncbi:MAG: peptide chain release factor N(5)-glutamine methyltransferase [Saprospiraceae bacterium]|nr:peptide chain release factor N(5)-glutamine methyltransferase [Saprospiraceae bacterium]